MKRSLSRSHDFDSKKKAKTLNDFNKYKSKSNGVSIFSMLNQDVLGLILDELSPPWKETLNNAINGTNITFKLNYNDHCYEIVKYGLNITKYFYEKRSISLINIQRAAVYHGNIKVFKWITHDVRGGKMNYTLYEYAILGNQIEMIKILLSYMIIPNNKIFLAFFRGDIDLIEYVSDLMRAGVSENRLLEYVCGYNHLHLYKYFDISGDLIEHFKFVVSNMYNNCMSCITVRDEEFIHQFGTNGRKKRQMEFLEHLTDIGLNVNNSRVQDIIGNIIDEVTIDNLMKLGIYNINHAISLFTTKDGGIWDVTFDEKKFDTMTADNLTHMRAQISEDYMIYLYNFFSLKDHIITHEKLMRVAIIYNYRKLIIVLRNDNIPWITGGYITFFISHNINFYIENAYTFTKFDIEFIGEYVFNKDHS